jgi:hypothetical protein
MSEAERAKTKSTATKFCRFIKTPSLKATPPRHSDQLEILSQKLGEKTHLLARPSLARTMKNLLYIYTRDDSIVNMPFGEDFKLFRHKRGAIVPSKLNLF